MAKYSLHDHVDVSLKEVELVSSLLEVYIRWMAVVPIVGDQTKIISVGRTDVITLDNRPDDPACDQAVNAASDQLATILQRDIECIRDFLSGVKPDISDKLRLILDTMVASANMCTLFAQVQVDVSCTGTKTDRTLILEYTR